jgi:plasmid stabilization system protein ParE
LRARRLHYAPEALDDLREIHQYLRLHASTEVASSVVKRLRETIRLQRETPNIGTPRPEFAPGCRFAVSGSYVIYYDHSDGVLTVMRVLHASRDRDRIMRGE